MNMNTSPCRRMTLEEAIEKRDWKVVESIAKRENIKRACINEAHRKELMELTCELNEAKWQLKIMTRYMMDEELRQHSRFIK